MLEYFNRFLGRVEHAPVATVSTVSRDFPGETGLLGLMLLLSLMGLVKSWVGEGVVDAMVRLTLVVC